MSEMSKNFQKAFSITSYDLNLAISLYTKEIDEIDPNNFAAWNNRGYCKVLKAIKTKEVSLLDDAESDFKKAIELAKEYTEDKRFPGAEDNIAWAKKVRDSLGG